MTEPDGTVYKAKGFLEETLSKTRTNPSSEIPDWTLFFVHLKP